MPRFPSTYRRANHWLSLLLLSWPLALPVVAHGEGQPVEETAKTAGDAAEPADNSTLTLKVLDPDGKPVAGAKVAAYIQWETGKIDDPRIYGFGESGEANETNPDGVVEIKQAALKGRMYDDELAICALDKNNKLIGLVMVTEKDLGATKEIHLQPGIRVELTLESTELEELGHKLEWRGCYLYVDEERPFFSMSFEGDRLGFLLPPGKYRYNAYGTSLVGRDDGEIDLTGEEPTATLALDLPASNLGRLIGQPAPELDGVAHWKNSEPLKLADLRGKVVVLDFWGYWCGPCVHSMPELVKLYDEFKDKGLEVIAVHDDSVDSVEELEEKTAGSKEELWDGQDLPFPIAIDGKGTEKMPGSEHAYRGQTVAEYGIRSWPTGILIDREGKVVGTFHPGSGGRKTLLTALGLEKSANTDAGNRTPQPPETEKKLVTDVYHGTKVTEHYRWLEDWSDPKVVAWSDAQNAYARSILDQLPNREAIAERVAEIMSAELVSYFAVEHAAGKFFAMKEQPPKQQPFLVVNGSLTDLTGERVLFDPNAADDTGGAAIVWYKPSFDGKLVAVCIAHGGAEVGDVTVYDVATGKQVGEIIPRVNTGTAGGDLAWAPDGSGFYYTRHPREGERPEEDMNFYQQVYFHKLGTPTTEDRYELGKDSPRIAETELKVDERTGRVLATIQNGDGGEFAHYLRGKDGGWQQFSWFEDKVIQAEFGPKDDLYVVTREGAPRGKIVRMPIDLSIKAADAETIAPEGDDAIVTSFWQSRESTVVVTDSRLYVVYQLGGPSEIRVFDLKGKQLEAPKQLPVSAVGHLERLDGDDVLFANESFVVPPAVYKYEAEPGEVEKTAFVVNEPVDLDNAEVVREFAESKDGTKVPVNIIFRKGTERNGQNPALVTGYGGYGVNYAPGFRALNRILLDHGFVIAVANIRGGGEYGEEWHRQGNLTKKQNVFDDFAASLKHLIERDYTSSDKLAIIGGSNGGLLMGAVLTQHPDLVKAVVASVGIYDMLRVELSPNGEFNITEFGTVKNPEHFKALHAYSPYHNVEDGVDYPAVLFLTGANDPRVDPMQSRKMTARLQTASPGAGPFLLRTSSDSGHGRDTPLTERVAQQVDIYAFLFDQLGVEFQD